MPTPQFIDVVSFGADPSGVNDSLGAFRAAVAAFANHDRIQIVIPPGNFYLSDTWLIDRPVTVIGSGQVFDHGTTLLIRNGRDGIRVLYQGAIRAGGTSAILENFKIEPKAGAAAWSPNTRGYVAEESVVLPLSGYSGLAFLCIKSGDSGPAEPDFGAKSEGETFADHAGNPSSAVWKAVYLAGIKLLANAEVKSVFASGFPGDGFSVFASLGDGNNANGWLMHRCLSTGNAGWGFFTQGADAQAGSAINCMSLQNGIGGFLDNSRFGNSYVGCLAEANKVYGYLVAGNSDIAEMPRLPHQPNNGSTFVGCYVEGGQSNRINAQAMWFGGFTDGSSRNRVYGTGNVLTNLRCNTLFFLNDTQDNGTGDSAYCRIGLTGSQTVMEWGFSQDQDRRLLFSYGNVNGRGTKGWVGTLYDGTLSHFAMSLQIAPEGPGHFWIPNDLYLGPFGMRNVFKTVSGGPPASGTFQGGDFAREASPHLSGMFGFQFVNGRWVAIQPKSTRASTAGAIDLSDYYYGLTTGGLTVTLPPAASVHDGHELVIKDESGQANVSPHKIMPSASDTIDGANTALTISARFGAVRLIRRNAQWWTIS